MQRERKRERARKNLFYLKIQASSATCEHSTLNGTLAPNIVVVLIFIYFFVSFISFQWNEFPIAHHRARQSLSFSLDHLFIWFMFRLIFIMDADMSLFNWVKSFENSCWIAIAEYCLKESVRACVRALRFPIRSIGRENRKNWNY